MWYIAAYIKIADPTAHPSPSGKLSSGGISAVAFFYLWTIAYTPTWNGTPWVLNSEMFDQTIRTLAQAFAAMNNWFWNFIISRFTPQMFAAMGEGGYGVYMFFASLMLGSIVFVWFLIPETMGVPLEAMDRLFEMGGPVRNRHRLLLEELREEEGAFRGNVGGMKLEVEKEGGEAVEREEV